MAAGDCGKAATFDRMKRKVQNAEALSHAKRKRVLTKLIKGHPHILYAQHFDGGQGAALFRLMCERDLEGVVAKRKDAAYGEHRYKIRNPKYCQYEGRRELFEKRREVHLQLR